MLDLLKHMQMAYFEFAKLRCQYLVSEKAGSSVSPVSACCDYIRPRSYFILLPVSELPCALDTVTFLFPKA